jgi:hypothetical protein
MFNWIASIYSIPKEVRKMATQISELATELANVKNLLVEAAGELTGKIDALEAALALSGELPQEAQDALEEVRATAQGLADIV